MANNFLKQLQNVVETGKLQGVTNIRDLYNTGFANSGISYKDFKKQMHDYKIYGNLGKNDMARLSGMYYGSKKADWEIKKPQDLATVEKRTFAPAFNLNTPNEISPLNIPVTKPVIQKTVVKSTPKNNSNKQQIAEVTKVVIPANSGDPYSPTIEQINNDDYDALNRQKHGGFAQSNTNEHNVYKNSRFKKWWDNLNIDGAVDNSLYGQWTDRWNKEGRRGIKENIETIMGLGDYIRDLMTIQKKQQGGQVKSSNKEQDAVMQFVKALAQTLQADPQQIIQAAQQNPEALKSAVQVYQESKGDIQKAAQAFSQVLQSKTQAAKHGAKLNYLKSLKNKCAEDEELYYFKKGGSIGCGCKKKEQGGELKEKKESTVSKFKKACGGFKVKFMAGGQTPKQNPKINPNDTVMVKGKPFVLTNSDGTSVNPKLKYPLYKGKVEEEDSKKAKTGDQDAKKRQDKRDTMEGDKKGGILKKSCGSKMPKEKCGAVMKFKNRKK